MVFGERIKQLRIENGWTQEYVCEKLSISSGALSRYETSMYEPKSLELIKDFANLFSVSTDYLLGKSNIRDPEVLDKELLDIGLSKKDYNPPTREQQEKIEEFAKFVLKDNLKKKEDK